MTLYTPEDLAPAHAAFRRQYADRMRVLLDGPCGRQVFALLLAVHVRNAEAEVTKAEIVSRTDYAEPTVRKALDRAEGAELVTVTRRRSPDRHRYYRLTPAGVEFAEQLAAGPP
jgi:DNA-binding transcriptional ArsR family regulator